MKLFHRYIFKIFLILTILAGWATAEGIKETESNELLNQGIASFKKGQYDQSIAYLNKAIEINPEFAEAYNNRGFSYAMKGQYDKAVADCTKAIEINLEYASAYSNRGVAYFYKREYKKAWDDVYKVQNLGYSVNPGFIKALRQASRKQE